MLEFIILSSIMVGFAALCENNKKNDKNYLAFFCIFFFLMSACRGRLIGNDTHSYLDLFSIVRDTSFENGYKLGRWESGYLIINKVLSYISSDPQIILFFSSAIFYLVLYKLFRDNTEKHCIPIIVFFVNGFFRFSMSAVRQILAISVLIIGLYFLKQKKFLVYFVFVAIAFSIHTSAVFAGGLFFLASKFKWDKQIYRAFAVLTIVLVLSSGLVQRMMGGIFNYSRYIGSIYDDGITIATVFLIVMCLICFAIMHYSYEPGADKDRFYQLEYVRLCVLIISLRLNSLDRFAEYFTLFEIIGVSYSVTKYKNRKTRLLLVMGIVGMYIAYSYIWGVMRPNTQMLWPYKTFWM